MKSKQITFLFIFLLGIVFAPSVFASDERVYIKTNAQRVAPSSEITATILVDAKKPVNAFDFSLRYPQDILQLASVSDAQSIVDLWKDRQWASDAGLVKMSGGIIKPFLGSQGEIVTLTFVAQKEGVAKISFDDPKIYLADGAGTMALALADNSLVTVDNQAELVKAKTNPDRNAPAIGFLETTTDPKNKDYVAVFNVKDSGSGLQSVSLRQMKWFWFDSWKKTNSPVKIDGGVWLYQISATDNTGNKVTKTEYILPELYKKILLGIILLLVLIVFYYIINKWLLTLLRKIF